MQIQKDEVKNNIINAAIEELLVSGYENSSMRLIATNAGITVGNIYSYFSGKDDLFEKIVYPTVKQISELIFMDVSSKKITRTLANEITNHITKAFLNNREEFLILMNSAKGSKYENIKSSMQSQIKERLILELIPQLPQNSENDILADTLALVLLDGIINIVLKSDSNEECMNRQICNFLLLVLGGIEQRI